MWPIELKKNIRFIVLIFMWQDSFFFSFFESFFKLWQKFISNIFGSCLFWNFYHQLEYCLFWDIILNFPAWKEKNNSHFSKFLAQVMALALAIRCWQFICIQLIIKVRLSRLHGFFHICSLGVIIYLIELFKLQTSNLHLFLRISLKIKKKLESFFFPYQQ